MPLNFLYEPDDRDRRVFGPQYQPPKTFEHAKWYQVAHYDKLSRDGQSVEIDQCKWPADFYRIRVLADTNSVGRTKPGYTLSTGSGATEFVKQFVDMVIDGMLGLVTNGDA